MTPVLVDTSVWIDFFKGDDSDESGLLAQLIDDDITVCLCPTILQEILQGFTIDSDHAKAFNLLKAFPMLVSDPVESAIGAADLYRYARKMGVTVRRSNDCLIAWYAIQHNVHVLHRDRDYTMLSKVSKLKILNDSKEAFS